MEKQPYATVLYLSIESEHTYTDIAYVAAAGRLESLQSFTVFRGLLCSKNLQENK
jgi:hypothetical protein